MLLRVLARQCMCHVRQACVQPTAASYSTFKSSVSLDKLYPQSSLDITKAQKVSYNLGVSKLSALIVRTKKF